MAESRCPGTRMRDASGHWGAARLRSGAYPRERLSPHDPRRLVRAGGETTPARRGGALPLCGRQCATTARRSAYDVSTLTQPCCTQDEGRPLAAALQEEAANPLTLRGSRARVVSEIGR